MFQLFPHSQKAPRDDRMPCWLANSIIHVCEARYATLDGVGRFMVAGGWDGPSHFTALRQVNGKIIGSINYPPEKRSEWEVGSHCLRLAVAGILAKHFFLARIRYLADIFASLAHSIWEWMNAQLECTRCFVCNMGPTRRCLCVQCAYTPLANDQTIQCYGWRRTRSAANCKSHQSWKDK